MNEEKRIVPKSTQKYLHTSLILLQVSNSITGEERAYLDDIYIYIYIADVFLFGSLRTNNVRLANINRRLEKVQMNVD